MPAVNKTRKKTTKRGAKSSARKRTNVRRGSFDAAASPSIWAHFAAIKRAAIAGLVVLAMGTVFILWSSGYFGRLAEATDRAIGEGLVNSGLEVKRITALGIQKTNHDEVMNAIGPVIGTSIMHYDLDSARARVENLGWVRAAAVSRLLPNTLHISVRERKPSAVWQLGGRMHLIDDSGAVIKEIDANEYAGLPLIVGAGAPEAAAEVLGLLTGYPELSELTRGLVRVGERRWNVRLQSGADLRLPSSGLVKAIDDIARIHAAHGLLDEPLAYIDLRDPENIILRERGADEDKPTSLDELLRQ